MPKPNMFETTDIDELIDEHYRRKAYYEKLCERFADTPEGNARAEKAEYKERSNHIKALDQAYVDWRDGFDWDKIELTEAQRKGENY